jgi:IS30 family transposase
MPRASRGSRGPLEFLLFPGAPQTRCPKSSQQSSRKWKVTAGHGVAAVRDAIVASMMTMPDQLRRSLTWDQGADMAQHAKLRIDTRLAIYFCDPYILV